MTKRQQFYAFVGCVCVGGEIGSICQIAGLFLGKSSQSCSSKQVLGVFCEGFLLIVL